MREALLKFIAALCFAAVLTAPVLRAQQPINSSGLRTTEFEAQDTRRQFSETLYSALKWRLIGPFRGGRVLAVTGVPGQPNTYYFGAVAGGIWKTTNGGASWQPVADNYPFWSIGAIAVAPSNPGILYIGTGEACIRGDITYGNGVWKSSDAGRTWQHVGLEDTRHIARILIDPHNPDIVFVAALGHAFGPNTERGVFRTDNGGASWHKVLYKDDKTGAIDLSFDPNNTKVIFAALYQVQRSPWELVSGGPGSGLYRSADGGTTWKQVTGNGFPEGVLGRIGVAVSGAKTDRIYAVIEAKEGGVYRSDNGGEDWIKVAGDSRFIQRAWYFGHIVADPKDADTVYLLNVRMFRSCDAGKTWQTTSSNFDNHALWIDPDDHQRMINGSDDGVIISTDGAKTWSTRMNQPIAALYHVATDNRFPYYIYGAQQDNTTIAIPSATDHGTIDLQDWYSVGGGESGFVVPYTPNPNIVFAGFFGGIITRYNKLTGELQDISPWPDNPLGSGAAPLKYRFQWTAPIALSPHDPEVLYHGANVVFRSTNMGHSWTVISPDLTRNDKSKQRPSGGDISKDNTGVEYFDTVFALAESPVEKGLIWAGSDDGLVHVTRDAGANWADVTPREMPEWGTVSLIDASPTDAATAYVAVDRHRLDDLAPYIFVTHNYGKTWTKKVAGIPAGSFVHAVRQDPVEKGMLYAGTETGVFVSWDDGTNWQSLRLNLPAVPVHDLLVKNNDLVIATHGRSFWSLDNITPLRQLALTSNSDVYFYQPAPAFHVRSCGTATSSQGPPGKNPPGPAILDYFFRKKPEGQTTLEIVDVQGKLVRKYSSRGEQNREAEDVDDFPESECQTSPNLPVNVGMNRLIWDLRYDAPTNVPGLSQWGGRSRGPLVLVGHYTARLTVAGKQYSVPLDVRPDPRVNATAVDLSKQFQLATNIARCIDEANLAINQMGDLRSQLDELKEKYQKDERAFDVITAANSLEETISKIEEEIAQTKSKSGEDWLSHPIRLNNKLSLLQQTVESADKAPTEQSYAVFGELSTTLGVALSKWHQILSAAVPALNAAIQDLHLPTLHISAGKSDHEW